MEDDSSTNLELRQSSSSKQTSTRSAPKPQRQESSTSNRKNSDSSAKSSIKRGLPSTASVRSGLEAGQTTRNGKDYYDEARRAVENQNRETFDTPVLESKPSNYLWLALFTTIFFNPLTGIVAMVMASKYKMSGTFYSLSFSLSLSPSLDRSINHNVQSMSMPIFYDF